MKPMTWVKIVIAVLAVGGLGVLWVTVGQDRDAINEHNRIIVELYNNQQYAEAYEAFKKLRPRADKELRAEITDTMLECCMNIAGDPHSSYETTCIWLSKAAEIDPDALDEQQKRIVQTWRERQKKDAANAGGG
jgi:hypothetical protein